MKLYITSLLITFLMVTDMYAQTSYRFNINNINLPINNSGVLGDVNIPPGGSGGKYNNIVFLFSGGFYLSGYNDNALWANGVSSASLIRDYQAGNVGSDPSAPENIIYVVAANDPPFGASWQNWSNAVVLGADFYDGDGDGIYNPVDKNNNGIWDPDEDKPDILGDLTAWCAYNDGVPASQRLWQGEPQGIEIQQTIFAYTNTHPQFGHLINTIFKRYRIVNKGTVAQKLDSVYFSTYDDFDIGDYGDDMCASDTLISATYVYNDGSDNEYGVNPPAVFRHFNQFPHVFIPGETFIDNNSNGVYDPGIDTVIDTAYYFRGKDLGIRTIPGARNSSFSSSVLYVGGFSVEFNHPGTQAQVRNFMRGLTRSGNQADPCNFPLANVFGGVNCSEVNPFFWVSGDPVNQTGWVYTQPWDIASVGTVGPFELHHNDYYDIIVAYTVARGNNAINSITVTRQNVSNAINVYLSNFGQFPVSVDEDEVVVNDYKLFQNYPNPFNPSTIIRYQIPDAGFVTLKIYDVLGREVSTLVNEVKSAGSHEVEFNTQQTINNKLLASGIYFYQLSATGGPGDYKSTKKMILAK